MGALSPLYDSPAPFLNWALRAGRGDVPPCTRNYSDVNLRCRRWANRLWALPFAACHRLTARTACAPRCHRTAYTLRCSATCTAAARTTFARLHAHACLYCCTAFSRTPRTRLSAPFPPARAHYAPPLLHACHSAPLPRMPPHLRAATRLPPLRASRTLLPNSFAYLRYVLV